MIQAGARQLRVGTGGVYGMDFGAVLALAAARGVTPGLLAEVLPAIERVVVAGLAPAEDQEGD